MRAKLKPCPSFTFAHACAGCHGSGKTALVQQFADMGFPVLNEGFMTMPNNIVHPQVSCPPPKTTTGRLRHGLIARKSQSCVLRAR